MDLIEIRLLSRVSEDIIFKGSQSVVDYCRGKPLELQTLAQEVVYCFCLDTKNNINSVELVSKGSLNTSILHPREVLKAAILANSASIILAHNHPSGSPDPSMNDIEMTKQIKKACDIMGINFLDHVIIGKTDNFSLVSHQMI